MIAELISLDKGKGVFLKDQVLMFYKRFNDISNDINKSLKDRDLALIKSSIHALKGSSGIVGASFIADSCKRIEALLPAKKHEEIAEIIDEIHLEYDVLKLFFDEKISSI